MQIREWNASERPIEKGVLNGLDTLSNAELLAIIIGTGTKKMNVVDLCRHLLSDLSTHSKNEWQILSQMSIEELKLFDGIGVVKAVKIKTALELAKRYLQGPKKEVIDISSPQDVVQLVRYDLSQLDHEVMMVLFLTTKNTIIKKEILSTGGLNSAVLKPRDLFRRAIKYNANALILAHNHPSGDPEPSQQDLEATKMYIDAGRIIGINILDHLVIGSQEYRSIRQKSPKFFE